MKRSAALLSFCLIAFVSSLQLTQAEERSVATDLPPTDVVIELDSVKGADRYDVEIKPQQNIWNKPYRFQVLDSDPKLRTKLVPGNYDIRTRSVDKRGTPSLWSTWLEFLVNYKSPASVYPGNNDVIQPASSADEPVRFEWPKVPGATGYHFVLQDSKGAPLKDEVTKEFWILTSLKVGSTYKWSLTPIFDPSNSDKQIGASANYSFKIGQPTNDTRALTIYAQPSPGAIGYQFEFSKLTRSGKTRPAQKYQGKLAQLKSNLASGTYEVRIRTAYNNNTYSAWSPPFRFFVPYSPAKAVSPRNYSVLEATDDWDTKVEFEWKPSADVHHYTIYIYDEDGELVKQMQSNTARITGTLPHDKTYRWTVVPHGVYQNEIDPPEVTDDMPGFRIGPYKPLRLAASEEPSHLYSWARYYVSNADYFGKNYDLNTVIHQNISSNSLEGAVGYWHRKSQFGLLAHGGISGFIVQDQLHNFANAGLHIGYRYITDGGTRIRAWVGATYSEFPEYLRSAYTKDMSYNRLKSVGTQFQLSYMDVFEKHPDYGYHLSAIFYHKALGLGTPNGLPQEKHLNYTLGIYGTYLTSDQLKWQLGYAYKHESAMYHSSDRSGNHNSSEITGHYLNLSLEWGLGEKMK